MLKRKKKFVVKKIIHKIPYHQFWININMINKNKVEGK